MKKDQLQRLNETEEKVFKALRKNIEDIRDRSITEWKRPLKEGECAYSNFDDQYELTEEQVKASGMYHQHAAYDFCGYVWFDPEKQQFIEQIWIYRNITNVLYGKTLDEVIQKAVNLYGSS